MDPLNKKISLLKEELRELKSRKNRSKVKKSFGKMVLKSLVIAGNKAKMFANSFGDVGSRVGSYKSGKKKSDHFTSVEDAAWRMPN